MVSYLVCCLVLHRLVRADVYQDVHYVYLRSLYGSLLPRHRDVFNNVVYSVDIAATL